MNVVRNTILKKNSKMSKRMAAGERSVDRLIVNSVIRLSVYSSGCSFARCSVCAFVCVSVLSIAPSFAQFFLLLVGLNMTL